MATVTSITAARAAAIEAASIVSGTVTAGNLILTRQNGTSINAGSVTGPQGAQGPIGASGSKWTSGAGAPSNILGVVSDWYINTTNGDVYEKTSSSVWTLRDNITGPAGSGGGGSGSLEANFPVTLGANLSVDDTTVITTGVKFKRRMPFGFTLSEVRIGVSTADTAAIETIDIKTAAGVSIFSTKPTIDVNEKTSETALTPSVLSTTLIADDEELTFSVEVTGTVARGLYVWLLGTRNLSNPATVPAQVGTVTATPGNTQVVLTWTAPSNGGSPITDYVVQYKLASEPTVWTTFADGDSGTSPEPTGATVTGLTNGSSYNFRVSAVNAIGTSVVSATYTTTPATIPSAPTALAGTPTATTNVLTWTAPSNGGSPITDYIVEYKLASEPTVWTTFADGDSGTSPEPTGATVTGLTASTSYNFRVSAVNAIGTSVVSAIYVASTAAGGTTTHTLNGTANRGYVSSFGAPYSTVRTTGLGLGTLAAMVVGQSEDAGDYNVAEAFLEFNTNVGGTVSSVTSLKINVSDTTDLNASFTLEVYGKDFGTSVTTADWVNGTSPGTLLASVPLTNGEAAGVKTLTLNGTNLASLINTAGTTRLVLMSSKQRLGTAPAAFTNEKVTIAYITSELVFVTT